jgi:hypothetical protein
MSSGTKRIRLLEEEDNSTSDGPSSGTFSPSIYYEEPPAHGPSSATVLIAFSLVAIGAVLVGMYLQRRKERHRKGVSDVYQAHHEGEEQLEMSVLPSTGTTAKSLVQAGISRAQGLNRTILGRSAATLKDRSFGDRLIDQQLEEER